MTSKFLIKLLAIISGVQLCIAIFAFLGTRGNKPIDHAVLGMALGLYIVWIILFGLFTLKFKDSLRAFVLKIKINWAIKFVIFCTLLAMLEEAITVAMTNTSSWYGLHIGQAYITVSANYWDVVLGNSVIIFFPLFIGYAWLLSKYDFSAHQVFLLFGLTGTLVESLYAGPQHFLEIGMWMFVYGLMVFLPTYSLPPRSVRPVRWYHFFFALIAPFAFFIILLPLVPMIHYLRPSTLIVFPPMTH